MLTAGQCRVVAYMTDGDIICADCADKLKEDALTELGMDFDTMSDRALAKYEAEHGKPSLWARDRIYRDVENEVDAVTEKHLDLTPLIQYDLDSDDDFQQNGLSCGDCGTELVEADPDEEDDDEV
jgi:hypothetical protein